MTNGAKIQSQFKINITRIEIKPGGIGFYLLDTGVVYQPGTELRVQIIGQDEDGHKSLYPADWSDSFIIGQGGENVDMDKLVFKHGESALTNKKANINTPTTSGNF